jgi:hypothetical protein
MNHSIVEDSPFLNVYYIVCNAITGNGDIETTTFSSFKKGQDEAYLEDLVNTLNRMKDSYPNGFNPLQGDYTNIHGFLGWFDSEHPDADSLYAQYPDAECRFYEYAAVAEKAREHGGTALKWPMEPATGYETAAKYHSHDIFYIDENGTAGKSPIDFG